MSTVEPEFDTYAEKPKALISGSYTTVRGAELAALDAVLDRQGGDFPVSRFKEQFGRPRNGARNTDHVEDCLAFLQSIDYVEVSPQNVVSRFNQQCFPELSFEARLLSHIRKQTGRPSHITYISAVCARMDERQVEPERLLEEVQADDVKSYADQLGWTIEKIRFWANLLDPLGALSYTKGSTKSVIIHAPTRALLAELITYYGNRASDGTHASDCFEWIDEWFYPIFSERANVPRLSVGVADTLESMETDGAIDMFRESDALSIVELPRDKGGGRTVSAVTVEEVPTGPEYSYPLARTTKGVRQ